VRWIRRGPLPPVLIERFGPFRDPIEQRADRYLVDRWTPGLGVKIRDAVQLDLKAYRGSAGYLRVPGGCGPLEVWEKWTFPLGEMSPEKETESWLALDKRRRKRAFELTAQGLVERSVREEGGPRCMFELTEVVGGGDLWWTLGFEASGAAETLEPTCEPASACSSSAHCPMASSSRRRPRCPTRAGSVNANPGHRAQLRLLVLRAAEKGRPGVARSWRIDARTRAARADIIPRTRGWGTTA
jgi:hypothetical protein